VIDTDEIATEMTTDNTINRLNFDATFFRTMTTRPSNQCQHPNPIKSERLATKTPRHKEKMVILKNSEKTNIEYRFAVRL
jgi:hypothetical protein